MSSAQSANTRDELFRQARELEADAIEVGEGGFTGLRLRSQAVELRRRALGERAYPVLTCPACFRLTGWVAANRLCDACLRREQLAAAYADPHGGWVSLEDKRQPPEPPPPPPLRARLAAAFGRRDALKRAIAAAWLSRVEPGETGPISPETGYVLEVARRDEVDAADGTGIVVRFTTAEHRFGATNWLELETRSMGDSDFLTPAEFSAGLPMEQLAEAWGDYRAEVVAFNRAVWQRESDRREAERVARAEREDALRRQHGTAELLDEDG